MTDREACILLNMISGIGYAKYSALTAAFGSPSAVFEQKPESLRAVRGIGEQLADRIANYPRDVDYYGELELAERAGVRILTLFDEAYPAVLREIYDPPLCLYVRGRLPVFPDNAIAVVGSRKMSAYGERMAKSLSESAVLSGFVIVSGLAYGVDAVAHRAAVENGGVTVAVLGGGLAKIHPQEHVPLARDIVELGGAVISEFPMNFPVSRTSFPRRNRIVSGLSRAVLVVEAGIDSGAMITAHLAVDQGKTVLAVPGHADNPQARGCHQLIREGAILVEDFSQIMQAMQLEFLPGLAVCEPQAEYDAFSLSDLSEEEKQVIAALKDQEKTLDALVLALDVDPGKLMGTLMTLEMKMMIVKNPDRTYTLR